MTEPYPFKTSDPGDQPKLLPERLRLEQGDVASFQVTGADPLPDSVLIMGSPVIAKFIIGGTEQTDPTFLPEDLRLLRIDDTENEDYQSLVLRTNGTDVRPGRLVLLAFDPKNNARIKAAAFITPSGLENVHLTYEVGREGNTTWFSYGFGYEETVNPFIDNPSVSRRHMRLWPSIDGRLTVFSDGSNQTTLEATDIHQH